MTPQPPGCPRRFQWPSPFTMSVAFLRESPTPSSWSLTHSFIHSLNTWGQRGGHTAGLAETGPGPGECGRSGPGVTIPSTARSVHDDHITGGLQSSFPTPLQSWPAADPQCSQFTAGRWLLVLADPTRDRLAESEVQRCPFLSRRSTHRDVLPATTSLPKPQGQS